MGLLDDMRYRRGLLGPPSGSPYGALANGAPSAMAGSAAADRVAAPEPQASRDDEADQAQFARDAAARRVARAFRAKSPPVDLVDVGKSTGIGLINGFVGLAGTPAEVLTVFGYLPGNPVANGIRQRFGYKPWSPDAPDPIDRFKPDGIRNFIEDYTPGFYRPTSRAGRYAETIGEMAPLILLGGGVSAARGAAPSVGRALAGDLFKHAVLPGLAVEGLNEALPDSPAGRMLQKAYPVVRQVLPWALAAKRAFRALSP